MLGNFRRVFTIAAALGIKISGDNLVHLVRVVFDKLGGNCGRELIRHRFGLEKAAHANHEFVIACFLEILEKLIIGGLIGRDAFDGHGVFV